MIECVDLQEKRLRVTEILETHKALYRAMNVESPVSL